MSTDLVGALTVGTASSVTTSRAGQNVRLALAGTVGPSPALEFAGLAFNSGTPGVSVVIYKPDGSTWTNTYHQRSRLDVDLLPPYPVNGTYTVLIEPRPSLGGAATITALTLTAEPGATLTANGPGVTTTFAISGETGRYVFSGTAGQNLGLGLTGLTLMPSNVTSAPFTVHAPGRKRSSQWELLHRRNVPQREP